jgi:hypothetical protein
MNTWKSSSKHDPQIHATSEEIILRNTLHVIGVSKPMYVPIAVLPLGTIHYIGNNNNKYKINNLSR